MSEGNAPSSGDLTVGAVAGLVGVSVRTLHHYDQIGVVIPTGRTPAGYRVYDDADVERLHQVLTYRELGFPLEQIATLLDDPHADALGHLTTQRDLLNERIARLHRMVAAVEDMMDAKKSGIQLSAAEQSEIFGDEWLPEEYSAEAQQRWGDTDEWKQSQQRTAQFSKDDWRQIKADADAFEARLADALRRGVEPSSAEANDLAEQHRASIEKFYDCGYEMQVCLGDMYVADPRFAKHYDAVAPGLAVFLRDVIRANAEGKDTDGK
ncbi:MerR family transcriptional regulator [Gordonia sp. w5E2]|uniref:Putative MerR family transcriptional regulator n=1 Tax=Gordonia sputi NBRC 100414 TaxID=1089453 RepID=H5U5F6_9ACTN|nr:MULTISPECIES: MerR family transcriptional regulator [Gordonia]NKY94176.1 MerR family transcriptional regulator [Gordonia sputi]OBA37198.1 transcriptional regulator [Gordonia sp. 852002-51296_SCH5728562-b]OBA69157.1 transcriptional regulator [Gordonia sp. 852002-10350_SCH5691597]GAB40964.1 putative MerR family transcriptional regulator [Gordonia sputi NBRC 100414]